MGSGVHPPMLASLDRVWDFSALGSPTSSVSRRVVKLTIPITILHHCHSKREAMGTKSKTLSVHDSKHWE